MKDEVNITDKIDRYLNGSMSGVELSQFESQLKSNPDLAIEIKQQQEIVLHIEEKGNRDLKSFLIGLENQDVSSYGKQDTSGNTIKPKKSATILTLRKLITGVAASLAIITASIWAFKTTQVNQTQDLFSEYYSPYPNDLVKIERSDSQVTPLQSAMTEYAKENYKSAIIKIHNYTSATPDGHLVNELTFFKAISYLSIGNIDEAKQSLQSLHSLESFEYADKVNWYLALTHINAGEDGLAKSVLQDLINSGQRYKLDEAKKLLGEI